MARALKVWREKRDHPALIQGAFGVRGARVVFQATEAGVLVFVRPRKKGEPAQLYSFSADLKRHTVETRTCKEANDALRSQAETARNEGDVLAALRGRWVGRLEWEGPEKWVMKLSRRAGYVEVTIEAGPETPWRWTVQPIGESAKAFATPKREGESQGQTLTLATLAALGAMRGAVATSCARQDTQRGRRHKGGQGSAAPPASWESMLSCPAPSEPAPAKAKRARKPKASPAAPPAQGTAPTTTTRSRKPQALTPSTAGPITAAAAPPVKQGANYRPGVGEWKRISGWSAALARQLLGARRRVAKWVDHTERGRPLYIWDVAEDIRRSFATDKRIGAVVLNNTVEEKGDALAWRKPPAVSLPARLVEADAVGEGTVAGGRVVLTSAGLGYDAKLIADAVELLRFAWGSDLKETQGLDGWRFAIDATPSPVDGQGWPQLAKRVGPLLFVFPPEWRPGEPWASVAGIRVYPQ